MKDPRKMYSPGKKGASLKTSVRSKHSHATVLKNSIQTPGYFVPKHSKGEYENLRPLNYATA